VRRKGGRCGAARGSKGGELGFHSIGAELRLTGDGGRQVAVWWRAMPLLSYREKVEGDDVNVEERQRRLLF
jgi:hypothetical protein